MFSILYILSYVAAEKAKKIIKKSGGIVGCMRQRFPPLMAEDLRERKGKYIPDKNIL